MPFLVSLFYSFLFFSANSINKFWSPNSSVKLVIQIRNQTPFVTSVIKTPVALFAKECSVTPVNVFRPSCLENAKESASEVGAHKGIADAWTQTTAEVCYRGLGRAHVRPLLIFG